MDKVFGKEEQGIPTNTKEHIRLIRRMVMEFLLGQQEISSKEIIKQI